MYKLGVCCFFLFNPLQIMVNSQLLAEGDPHQCIYALGDCAQVRGHLLPCTAQVAERQGRYLASAMAHTPTTENPSADEFVFKPWGMLAYVGGYKAIHDTQLNKSQGEIQVFFRGLWSFLCKRIFVLLPLLNHEILTEFSEGSVIKHIFIIQ